MKKLLLMIIGVLVALPVFALEQSGSDDPDFDDKIGPLYEEVVIDVRTGERIYELADVKVKPEFPGGRAAMLEFISKNIRLTDDIYGMVMLTLTFSKDGSLLMIEVDRSPHKLLTQEAVRLVKSMPKWVPARNHDDEPVEVNYRLAIPFKPIKATEPDSINKAI